MITAALSLAALGAAFGALLAISSEKFKVEGNKKAEAILEVLPGANCGGCGFPGCSGLAEAMAKGEAPLDACVVGSGELAQKIADILGVKLANAHRERRVAQLKCHGGSQNCSERFVYEGIPDCRAAANVFNGPKSCQYACLGFGNCARVCPFGAITMGEDNLPHIDPSKCTGCNKCVEECPRMVLELVGIGHRVHVRCRNTEKGKDAKGQCKVACIKCRLCEKNCPHAAIKVLPQEGGGSVAVINYDLCTNCGICVEKCPSKCIHLTEDDLPLEPHWPQKSREKKGCAGCPSQAACGH